MRAAAPQARNTSTMTAFLGFRPWEGGEVYLSPELMQGFGLDGVHGVAAFPNGEAQKSNYPTPRFNMARMYLRQTWGLGGEQETIPDGPNQLATKQDIDRITVTAGKFAVLDFFNLNAYSGEPRTGFLNSLGASHVPDVEQDYRIAGHVQRRERLELSHATLPNVPALF